MADNTARGISIGHNLKYFLYVWFDGYHKAPHMRDWLIEHGLTSLQTRYGLYGRRSLQVRRPDQQYQSTEGTHRIHN